MSTTVSSDTKKPPRPNNDPLQSPSLMSSLPNDMLLNILARVPRRFHQTLSCLSKSLRFLVRSSEFLKTRSLLGKDDSFHVCFVDSRSLTYHWFTLSLNTTTGLNNLVSIPCPRLEPHSAALMIGHEIYILGGSYNHITRNMWILDSRSGKLRQGPSTLVARGFAAVGVVDEKIYVLGGCKKEDIQSEVFDTKTQTWKVASNTNVYIPYLCKSVVSPSLDKKIYVRRNSEHIIVYDPSDGKCDKIEIHGDQNLCIDLCVINNVLYIYQLYVGLMWYDSKKKQWKVVKGLKLNDYSATNVAMAEYNGKLAFLRDCYIKGKNGIWFSMISLDWNGLEIVGKVEWSNHVLSVPIEYKIMHCLGRTD